MDKRLKEGSLLLLRGFDSISHSLSQLTSNLENALQVKSKSLTRLCIKKKGYLKLLLHSKRKEKWDFFFSQKFACNYRVVLDLGQKHFVLIYQFEAIDLKSTIILSQFQCVLQIKDLNLSVIELVLLYFFYFQVTRNLAKLSTLTNILHCNLEKSKSKDDWEIENSFTYKRIEINKINFVFYVRKVRLQLEVGMAMGRVFSSTRPALPLMGRGLILINRFETSLRIFFKTQRGFGYCPTPPCLAPIIYKIKF